MTKNILLVCGGDSQEHDISLVSADFLYQKLCNNKDYNVIKVCLHNQALLDDSNKPGRIDHLGNLVFEDKSIKIDAVVPCIHGVPGESGEFQAFLELYNIPYIGCDMQSSINCFNKITTKLYLNALEIPNTPFIIINDKDPKTLQRAADYFDIWKDVYIKAACQGSSFGCYHVKKADDLKDCIFEAFTLSNEVLMEQSIVHRELEVAAFEINGEIVITNPGEIVIPDNEFYTFEQKYDSSSKTTTTTDPKDLGQSVKDEIKDYALKAFKGLKLRDLSRIDFFLSDDNDILINEINTFPGMTPISMFPKLLENAGFDMTDFLTQCIDRAIARKGQKRIL